MNEKWGTDIVQAVVTWGVIAIDLACFLVLLVCIVRFFRARARANRAYRRQERMWAYRRQKQWRDFYDKNTK